jgi:uncharacterized membrane protein
MLKAAAKGKIAQTPFAPRSLLALFLITIAGILVRFTTIDSKVCWHDEALTLQVISGFPLKQIATKEYTGELRSVSDLSKYQKRNPDHGLNDSLVCLLKENTLHAPLYYVIAWLSCAVNGPALHQARLVSAWAGALVPPVGAWLVLELCGSVAMALVTAGLFALSPFLVIYSQEAREYSLWTLALLTTTAAFLKAYRTDSARWWRAYAIALVCSLYSHIFTLAILGGQALFLLVIGRGESKAKLKHWLVHSGAAVCTLTPWIVASCLYWSKVVATPGVVSLASNRPFYLQLTAGNLVSPFYDAPYNSETMAAAVGFAVIAFELVALLWLIRKAPQSVWLTVICLGTPVFLVLVSLDACLGGARATAARYITPTLVAVLLSCGCLLGSLLESEKLRRVKHSWTRLGVGLTLLLTIAGMQITALSENARATVWWHKKIEGANLSEAAAHINADSAPLVISSPGLPNEGNILALSHLLDSKVKLLLVPKHYVPDLPSGFTAIYIVSTARDLLSGLAKKYGVALLHFNDDQTFWQLVKVENDNDQPPANRSMSP